MSVHILLLFVGCQSNMKKFKNNDLKKNKNLIQSIIIHSRIYLDIIFDIQ